MNSMWKRSFALLLSLVMVFGMVPVNAFAEETEHSHSYETTVTDPTCTAVGYTTYTCACGDTYTADEVAATGHSYADGICSVCGAEEPAAEEQNEEEDDEIVEEETEEDEIVEEEPVVCDGTENCAAETHETTCECYDWCAALGCSEETHHADCPWGPCTLTEGCELVKGHPGECTGAAVYDASNITTATALSKAVANGGEITLGADITLTEVILLSKSVTINGNGHKISSSATRVFRLTTENIEVTMNNVNMVNTAVRSGSNDIRGVSIDDNAKNAKLTLNSCSVDFSDDSAYDWSYAVNDVGSNNCEITISGGSYEGANVFNIRGSNHTINISGVTATSLYKPNGAYMGVVVKLNGTGSTVTVSNSTFNGGHAKAFEENNSGDNDVTFTGLTNNLKYYIVMIGSSSYYTLEEASNQEVAATLLNPYTLNGEAAFSSIAVSDFAKQNGQTRTITLGENGILKVTEIDSDDGVKIVAKDVNSKVVYKDGAYRAVAKDRVASIGDVVYESLAEAVAAAADGDTITLVPGTYTMVNTTKKLTFKGESRTETVFDFTGADYTSIAGVNDITFENLTINRGGAYYRGFYESAKETYKDCDIKGVIWTYAKEANFIGCTFNQDAVEYNIWTYGAGKVNFTDCTFNCAGKSVLVYNEGHNGTEVNVTNCKFVASQPATGKAAIEIDSSLLKGDMFVVNIDAATTATGFDEGSVSHNTLWNNKSGILTEVNAPEGADLSITYEAVAPQITVDAKVDPEIAESITATVPPVEGLDSESNEAAVKEAIGQLTVPAVSLEVTTSVTLSTTETADGKTNLTYDVTPVVQAKNAAGTVVGSAEITNLAEEITFHLPVPDDYTGTHVTVYHEGTYMGVYPVNQEGKYVEVKSKEFSAYTVGLDEKAVPVASLNGITYPSLQAAVDEASKTSGTHTITLIDNVTETVTIKQTEGVNLIIDGAKKTFTGKMIVHGQGRQDGAETLKIQNVNFVAPEGADACILSPRDGYSYSHNLTVSGCTFSGGSKNATAAIRQAAGGDKNWTIENCTVNANIHSLLQVTNIGGQLIVKGCTVNAVEGVNLNHTPDVVLEGNTINAEAYAVRVGTTDSETPVAKIISMSNNTLTATASNGSAVVIRSSSTNSSVNMDGNVVSGATHISGTTEATRVNADENYWDGKKAPEVFGTEVPVASYYEDAQKTSLKPTEDAVAEIDKTYFLTFEEAVAAADSTKTIVLRKDVVSGGFEKVIKVDLNGHKLRASFPGTIIMNGGTYNDANIGQFPNTGKPMIAPLGTAGYDFLSNNGVFEVSPAGIDIVSGYVTLGQSTGTQIGHTLTVKEGAEVVIPAGKNLALRGPGIVDGGKLTTQGAIMLEAGTKNGTAYSATLKAPAGLNVIVCNCGQNGCDGSGLKVEYINGYYKLVTNDVAAYIGDKTYTDLNTAINDAADSATIVLVEDADIGNTTVNKNIALNLNGNKLVGNILVSSGKSVKIDTVNKNNVPYGIVLDGGDSVIGSDGKLTVTAAKDTNSNYGSFLITKPDGANKTIARKVFLEQNATFVADSTTSFDVTKADFRGEYLLDKDGNGIISKTDIYSEFLDAAGNPMYAPSILKGEKVTIKVRNSAFLDACTQIYVNNERVYNKQANIPTVNTSVKVYVGCTELELTADYVKNLPAGTHSVKFYHTIDGTDYITESKFTVYTVYNANADTTNPKTGDEIALPMFVMFSTAAALAVLVMGKKKYF